jgi:DNA-binding HxlR family transcriptional regulator
MTQRHRDGEPGLWLDIALQPGVIEILAALFNRGGPLTFNELCKSVTDSGQNVAGRAVSRLGACGLLQRACRCTGSWDEPDPSAHFELTDRGYGYTQTIEDLAQWARRLPSAQTRQPDRRHAQ